MSSARRTAVLTPSDTVDLAAPAQGLRIGGAGHLKVQLAGDAPGDYRQFKNLPAGRSLGLAVTRVLATGTTATGITALLAGEGAVAYRGAAPSDVPAWVTALAAPSGDLPALAFDFKNGRYWDGTAETADPLDVLVENTAWGAFNIASIQAGFGLAPTGAGGIDNNAAPVVVETLAAPLLVSGMTTLIVALAIDNGNPNNMIANVEFVQLPDFNTEYSAEMVANIGGFEQSQHSNATVINQDDFIQEEPTNDITGGIYKLATIIDLSGVRWAVNGTSRTTAVATAEPASPWTHIGFLSANNAAPSSDNVSPIRLIALYPPQPVGDLLTLSAL